MKQSQKKTLLCALLLTILVWFFRKESDLPDDYLGKNVSTILSAMPKSDRKKLEYFFRELIVEDSLGYTLLGEKPMSLLAVEEKVINPFASWSMFRDAIIPRRTRSNRNFLVWKRYEKFFPITRFALFYEKEQQDGRVLTVMTAINKKAFTSVVEKYREDFTQILHCEVTAEYLLEEGMKNPFLAGLLMNHDALIGILLGYGRENAYLFHQKSQFSSQQEKIDFFERSHFDSVWTEEEFEAIRKKYDSVNWISTYITGSHVKNLDLMVLPGFGGLFDSPETRHWRNHYLETRQAIIDYYKDKDFLEATLYLLTS